MAFPLRFACLPDPAEVPLNSFFTECALRIKAVYITIVYRMLYGVDMFAPYFCNYFS